MKRGDRVFDVGRVAGEIQHAFMAATTATSPPGPSRSSGTSCGSTAATSPIATPPFASVTSRLPYYMAMNLLRVARNDYVGTLTTAPSSSRQSNAKLLQVHAEPMTVSLDGVCRRAFRRQRHPCAPSAPTKHRDDISSAHDRALPDLPGHRSAPPPAARRVLPDPGSSISSARASTRRPPRFDAVGIWRSIVHDPMPPTTPGRCRRQRIAAASGDAGRDVPWGIAHLKLKLYPHVRHVLNRSCGNGFCWGLSATPKVPMREANCTRSNLPGYLGPVIISGDHGFRKPDRRLFHYGLDAMGVEPGRRCTWATTCSATSTAQGGRHATVMFDSDQGTKAHPGCVPDHTITDFRDLLQILGLPRL